MVNLSLLRESRKYETGFTRSSYIFPMSFILIAVWPTRYSHWEILSHVVTKMETLFLVFSENIFTENWEQGLHFGTNIAFQ